MASIVNTISRHWLSVALLTVSLGYAGTARAQDATWLLNPASNNFNTGAKIARR